MVDYYWLKLLKWYYKCIFYSSFVGYCKLLKYYFKYIDNVMKMLLYLIVYLI